MIPRKVVDLFLHLGKLCSVVCQDVVAINWVVEYCPAHYCTTATA